MSEQYPYIPEGMSESRQLELLGHLDLALTPSHVISDDPEHASAIRSHSIDELGSALADYTINDELAKIIIHEHVSRDIRYPDISLYAYWSIIRSAQNEDPGIKIPISFIAFAQELAMDQEETSIAFKLLVLGSNLDRVNVNELNDYDGTTFEEYVEVFTIDLREEKVAASLELEDILEGSYENLFHHTSDEHLADMDLIDKAADNPNYLLNLIKEDQFKTEQGYEAAKTRQDSDRLDFRRAEPDILLKDIRYGYFRTREGLELAKVLQDVDRLNYCIEGQENPHQNLLQAIQDNRFLTEKGINAAKAHQDMARLKAHGSDVERLRNDYLHHRFLTARGVAEAKRILQLNR